MNIVTGKVATNVVNVDHTCELGSSTVQKFEESLPQGFYIPLKKSVINMDEKKEKSQSSSITLDSSLLYSRVIALQTNRDVKITDVLNCHHSHHLCLKMGID